MKNIYFLGRFPAHKEVGGVTSFTFNFAEKFNKENLIFIDIYPAIQKEIPKNTRYKLITGRILTRLLKILIFFSMNKGNYLLNFSTMNSLLLIFFLPKKKSNAWFVILHNGDQLSKYEQMNFFKRKIIHRALLKIDAFGAISNQQKNFYNSIGVKNIYRISPYISFPSKNASLPNTHKKKTISFLMSGFPTKIYRIIESLQVLEKIWAQGYKFNVNLCLYGQDSDNLKTAIISYANKLPFVKLFSHIGSKEFHDVLKSSDVYIRMNSVDSFGLVVAEAINCGLKTIATKVCERYPGSYLIEPDDFTVLESELIFFLENLKFSDNLSIEPLQDKTSFEEIIDILVS